MTYKEIYEQIKTKGSFLCVGLDSDEKKLPHSVASLENAQFEFNKRIIDATAPYAVAYKINTAFYEAAGASGFAQLQRSAEYIKENYPDIFLIADAKRGDIGNTAKLYARAFFETMPFDAVTLAPYMGSDSIRPFLEYEGKWAIILALTSNASATDFETLYTTDGDALTLMYERVIKKANSLGGKDNIMFVAGATRPEMLGRIRELAPDNFLLVPGVGAQGGTVADVAEYGRNKSCGLLVNSSRGVIFASSSDDYAEAAAASAKSLAESMKQFV